jgi:hypothetical protein
MSDQKTERPGLSLRQKTPPLRPMAPVSRRSRLQLAAVAALLLVGALAPAAVVAPGATTAPVARILVAVALTVVPSLGAMAVGWVAFRRTRNYSWLIVAFIPSFTLILGGVILAATKAG